TVRQLVAETAEGRLVLDPRDRIISWSIICKGTWEPDESRVLGNLLRPGDCVIDVGAHVGWYTMLFANRVGENGTVFAFEPAPENFALLKVNVELNSKKNVRALNLSLGDGAKDVLLARDGDNFGDHYVVFGDADRPREGITVRCAALDDAITLPDRIRLIKLDCQGAEPAILAGATNALARCDFVATEFWPKGIRRAGLDPERYIEFLAGRFKAFHRLGDGEPNAFRTIAELTADAASVVDSADYLFSSTGL
ncbi:MAG: FkbM family methyltransferase, partial [Vulcanimicrobiaceae bacterium]